MSQNALVSSHIVQKKKHYNAAERSKLFLSRISTKIEKYLEIKYRRENIANGWKARLFLEFHETPSDNSLIKRHENFLLGYVFLCVNHMEIVQLRRHDVVRCHECFSVPRKFLEIRLLYDRLQ